jgi:hypothetical protein
MMMARNIHFSLLIRINRQLHEFNFRQRSAELLDADTSDERGERYYFKMIKTQDSWTIQGTDLPKWITDHESLIHENLVKREGAER